MGLENKYNSSPAFGLSSVLPPSPPPLPSFSCCLTLFCGKIQQSALSLGDCYEHLSDPVCCWGGTVSTSTKPLLQPLLSHLTEGHYRDICKGPGVTQRAEQSKDMICKSSSLASSLVQARAAACTAHPARSLALCLGYWCKAPSLLQTTTFALCLCRQVHKSLIQKSDQGRGLGMLDQLCQYDLENQESYRQLCAAGLIFLSASEKCYIKSADTCKEQVVEI